MAVYAVWYSNTQWIKAALFGAKPDPKNLAATHIHLIDYVIAGGGHHGLSQVYAEMQGEVWSPNGEARAIIRAKGLTHTSMCVGDVMVERDGTAWMVGNIGFTPIGNINGAAK